MNPLDESTVDRAASAEPPRLREARRTAYAHFQKLGMPTPVEELWRYVELDFDIADYGTVAEQPGSTPATLAGLTPAVSVVDGIAGGGRLGTAVPGVWVGSLADGIEDRATVLQGLGGPLIAPDLNIFAAAHGAFGGDGALIHVGRGTVSEPLLIDVVASSSGAISFPRILVVADELAEASVIVHLRSADDVDAVVVPHLEVVAGAASNVKISIVQNLGTSTRSIAHCRAVVGRDAGLVVAEAGLGGSLSRLHLTVDLEGRGSSANVVGAYFGDNQQVLDYRYFMHHAGLNTRSDMFLKGAVEDEALSVFTGMIRIDEEAQKTDAYQTNRNLILSDGAAAQSVPNLEILANDVKCGHGSTMGPLDREQRYYLMSRGLDPKRADRLQVRGFFQEALAKFPHRELVQPLAEWINAKFITAQEEGRL